MAQRIAVIPGDGIGPEVAAVGVRLLSRISEARELGFIVLRENTEGLYTGTGGTFKKGTPDEIAQEVEINTRKGVERICEAAFAVAEANKKRRVCMADKANVLLHGHGLWRRVFAEVARRHPAIEAKAMFVDALAMDL